MSVHRARTSSGPGTPKLVNRSVSSDAGRHADDGRLLYLGSANWTGAGLGAKGDRNRNFELGIVTEDETMLDDVQAIDERLWLGGECAGCGRRELCEAPLDGKA